MYFQVHPLISKFKRWRAILRCKTEHIYPSIFMKYPSRGSVRLKKSQQHALQTSIICTLVRKSRDWTIFQPIKRDVIPN